MFADGDDEFAWQSFCHSLVIGICVEDEEASIGCVFRFLEYVSEVFVVDACEEGDVCVGVFAWFDHGFEEGEFEAGWFGDGFVVKGCSCGVVEGGEVCEVCCPFGFGWWGCPVDFIVELVEEGHVIVVKL